MKKKYSLLKLKKFRIAMLYSTSFILGGEREQEHTSKTTSTNDPLSHARNDCPIQQGSKLN